MIRQGAVVLVLGVLLFFLGIWMFWVPGGDLRTELTRASDPLRGDTILRLGGCIACHTDHRNGGAPLAGGAPIATEFGVFYPPNITPHDRDGLGNWHRDDFIRAMTMGIDPHGQPYYPVFPYTFYTHMTTPDLDDLWAALQALPAISGRSPPHRLDFPYRFRALLRLWQFLYLDPGVVDVAANRSESWNRGHYIVTALGHCGACHTPRSMLGGRQRGHRFAGGIGPDGEKVPAITLAALLAADWTKADLADALEIGFTPEGDILGGVMAEFIRHNSSHWSPSDRAAVAEFLLQP